MELISRTEPCDACNENGEIVYRGVEIGPCYVCLGTKIRERTVALILEDMLNAINKLIVVSPLYTASKRPEE